MAEGQTIREVDPKLPLVDAIQEIFERRAKAGERKVILETYRESFEKLLMTIPKENRDTIAIKIQKVLVDISGQFAEYGSRFMDFIRNTVVFPMLMATEDFPKDKYYQLNLSGAKAWGEFALNTTKTATAERVAYRDHIVHAAATGIPVWGTLGAVGLGLAEGAAKGSLFSPAGAAVGAVAGGIGGFFLGGGTSLFYSIKDALIGPPIVYYNLFTFKGPTFDVSKTTQLPSMPGRQLA